MTAKELQAIADRDLNEEEVEQWEGLMGRCLKLAEGGHYQMTIRLSGYKARVIRKLKLHGFVLRKEYYKGLDVWVLSWEDA